MHKENNISKIVVAPDSFKGSLTAVEAADAIARGISSVMPQCQVVKMPVGDGGEGTAIAIISAAGGKEVSCTVSDPLFRQVTASYGLLPSGAAVIEMAEAAGLTLLSLEERNPLAASTFGVGELIRDALNRGCRDFVMCIGGSATNDAGMGMLSALGFIFLDSDGREISPACGEALQRITDVDMSGADKRLADCRFTVACDVKNPFYGSNGAAYVYAPQKGADADMVKKLDHGLQNFARVIERTTAVDVSRLPGAGAAGGMGGGMVAFLNASLKPGIELVLDTLDFDTAIAGADIVITGEGCLDSQTLMGKAPMGVLSRASRQGIPTIALGGSVHDADTLTDAGFAAVLPILPYPASLHEAMEEAFAAANLSRTASQVAHLLLL